MTHRTNLGSTVWDRKPDDPEQPINWVELKTSEEIRSDFDMLKFEQKLLRMWAQSFLLGVPKIIVGFRSKNGILERLEEFDTQQIPGKVKRVGKNTWDGNLCINFTAAFLDCRFFPGLSFFLSFFLVASYYRRPIVPMFLASRSVGTTSLVEYCNCMS